MTPDAKLEPFAYLQLVLLFNVKCADFAQFVPEDNLEIASAAI